MLNYTNIFCHGNISLKIGREECFLSIGHLAVPASPDDGVPRVWFDPNDIAGNMSKVLIACEESQAVTIAMRLCGHEAYSCDVEPCSGGHPEWHLQQDVTPLLSVSWDMVIAFPPCTHLAVSGARYFTAKRADGRQQQAIDFFMQFADNPCPRIAIENPVGIMSTVWRRPDQIIQPWMFGHEDRKTTCLWLKGLPLLSETNRVADPGLWQNWNKVKPGPDRGKIRSKTYSGIAQAMADQWGRLL